MREVENRVESARHRCEDRTVKLHISNRTHRCCSKECLTMPSLSDSNPSARMRYLRSCKPSGTFPLGPRRINDLNSSLGSSCFFSFGSRLGEGFRLGDRLRRGDGPAFGEGGIASLFARVRLYFSGDGSAGIGGIDALWEVLVLRCCCCRC